MPQFDFFSFFVQIFWLTIGIVFLFLFLLKYPISSISEIQKFRKVLLTFLKVNENSSQQTKTLWNKVIGVLKKK